MIEKIFRNVLASIFFYSFFIRLFTFFLFVKMFRATWARYYQKNKQKIKKKKRKRYKSFTEEGKKKQKYCCEQYENLSEDEKQRLVEYKKRYEMQKK